MNIYRRYLMAALLMALAISVSSASTFIPRDTVIPVTLDKSMSSATSRTGNTFYAHQTGTSGEGFPDNTRFTGNVDSVTRASGRAAGQIGVSFVGAKMPNGTKVAIEGQLVSLDDKNVTTDSTGRLVGNSNAKKANLKFAAIGAGGGYLIGQISGKNKALYTVLGAAAGYFYGQKQAKAAIGKDVTVPAGTRFGILLGQDVTVPGNRYAAIEPASVGAGPNSGQGWRVTFDGLQPVMNGNDLMVPFRSVMSSIDVPFDYDTQAGQITANDNGVQSLYTVGTRTVSVNGQNTRIGTASQFINGSLYVPASYMELITNRAAYWNQRSGVLRLE